MAETEILVALRTFAGPNIGAEVMLPEGVYTIGTDGSCDIVLSDSSLAARHAAFSVAPRQKPDRQERQSRAFGQRAGPATRARCGLRSRPHLVGRLAA